MKACIIKKYYQSDRDPSINQTVYLVSFKGGEWVNGVWSYDIDEAHIFDRKTHAEAICKGMKIDGLSIVEVSHKLLWQKLGDVPVNDDGELEEKFLHFEEGTDREEIWSWFEETFNISVGAEFF